MSFHLRPQEKFNFFSPDFHETHQYLTALRADFARQVSSKSISKYKIPFTTAKCGFLRNDLQQTVDANLYIT